MASGNLPWTSLSSQKDSLELASMLIDKHLQDDDSFLDLSERLRVPADNQPCVSGLQDDDYPTILEEGLAPDMLTDIGSIKRVPLPAELVEHFGHMQYRCSMGLFTDIERAWLAVDNDIFIWKYEDGSDVLYYDGVDETIVCAALLKPKPNVFQPFIKYLLCLATTVDIVLLGVKFTDSGGSSSSQIAPMYGEMHLLTEPLFTVQTDNVLMISIVSTDDGRIFMAGQDGCLYELAYRGDQSWLGRKCEKINHSTSVLSYLIPSFLNFALSENDPLVQISIDKSRKLLYTRSEKGTIQAFDMGDDGKRLSRVAVLPQSSIVHIASNIARTIDSSLFKPIVHIAAVTAAESSNIHLVCLTQSGVRIYFVTKRFGNVPFEKRPSMLKPVHVRLPPGFSANANQVRPRNVHQAYYSKGTLLLVQPHGEESDLLWTVSGDCLPFQHNLMESLTTVSLEGRTWAVSEVPLLVEREYREADTFEKLSVAPQRPDPPLVVTQHDEPPRKFVFINSQGTHILYKMRPVDQLRHLLLLCQGPDADEVKSFFRLHKVDQACAACLIIACSRLATDQEVGNWARAAFSKYGGEPHFSMSPIEGGVSHNNVTNVGISPYLSNYSSPSQFSSSTMYNPGTHYNTLSGASLPGPGVQPVQMSTPTSGFLNHQQQQQQAAYHSVTGRSRSGSSGHEIVFSGKHNGICLYLARILRPVWDSVVTKDYPCKTKMGTVNYLVSRFSGEELEHLLNMVRDVAAFVNSQILNSPITADSMSSGVPLSLRLMGLQYDGRAMDDQTRNQLLTECQKMERTSLENLKDLITQVEQVLGLLKVLVDHQFHVLAKALMQDHQNLLKTMTFKQIVISGKEMCSALIQTLIERYLNDHTTISVISNMLRKVCPRLYSRDDETCSEVNELLHAARINPNQMEKKQQLNEALKLYKAMSQPLQLSEVCAQLAGAQYYEGIVDLCLSVAQKRDPQNIALYYHMNRDRLEDTQGMQAYMQRMECYKHITETLNHLLYASVSPSTPKTPGQQLPAPDPNRLAPAEAELQKEQVFKFALQSDDELFHVSLYDWMLHTNLRDRLISIQTPYIEKYLKWKASTVHEERTVVLDLLWKYYEKNKNFPATSRILSRLAEKHGTDLDLSQRLEYLSRAIVCAKGSSTMTSVVTDGEFLHELEEKMEVAKLQMMVFNAVSNAAPKSEALKALNSDLLPITDLYKLGDGFGLHECKLAIIHSAALYDSALIENQWQSIIDAAIDSARKSSAVIDAVNIIDQLVPVAKLYVNGELYFPVAFIIKYMEQRSCQLVLKPCWVFRMMLEIGVKPAKLLQIYDCIFKSRDPCWQRLQKPLHLFTVLYHLIETFANTPGLVPVTERTQFATHCLDAVSSYLVELQAISSTDPQVCHLTCQFRSVQAKLERM